MACVKRLHAGLSAQKTQIQTYSTQRRTTSARAVQSRLDTDARVQLPHTLVTPPSKNIKILSLLFDILGRLNVYVQYVRYDIDCLSVV